MVQLAGRSQATRPVPQAPVDGVILDSIETTDVVESPSNLSLSKPGRSYASHPDSKPSACYACFESDKLEQAVKL
jgi:hypothetical protein